MQNKTSPLLRILQGIIIGSGAILPGISGGVLCVTFGLYQPLMELLAHPIRGFRSAWRTFLPVVIGWLAGFWLFAKVLELFFTAHAVLAVSLFLGLIAGSYPSLLREANREGRSAASWVSFGISTAALLAFFLLLDGTGVTLSITPNIGWFFFCGILWGLSLIVPGMSMSALLIYMGLFEPLTAGIAAFSTAVLLPMLAGICAAVFPFARLVERLFKTHYAPAFWAVTGFVTASALSIIPRRFASVREGLLALLCAVLGFLAAWGLDRLGCREQND